MIFIIYGINGVGKDSIVELISEQDSRFIVISQSRLLMYHLGFTKSFLKKSKIVDGDYKKLELIPEKEISAVRNNLCYDSILKLSSSGKIILYLSHLTVARFFAKEKSFVVPEVPNWVKEKTNGLVFIDANKRDVVSWRKKDSRKRLNSLIGVSQQQQEEKKEWLNLTNSTNIPFIIIKNEPDKLEKAAEELKSFIEEIQKQTP